MGTEASQAVEALIRARFPGIERAGADAVAQIAGEAERLAIDAEAMRGRLGPGDAPDLLAVLAAGALHDRF
jgi:hypothetical protein